MKIAVTFISLLLIVVACQRKSAPNVSNRTDGPEAPATPVVAVISAADLQAGQVVYTTSCAKCHKSKPVENWTVEQWNGILKSMIPKARLDSVQSFQVTGYVHANAKKG